MHSASDEDSSSPFDEALQAAGGFGRFQILLVALFLSTGTLHYCSNHLSQIFILLPPDNFGCRTNGSGADVDSSGLSYDNGSASTLLACGLKNGDHSSPVGLSADGSVLTCPQGWEYIWEDLFPTIATQNNWVCGDSWKQYATHMMFCVGSMCGYLISGFLSDRYGRRPTIAFLSGLAAFSNVFPLVIRSDIAIMSARFLAGISADTVCSIVFLLVMEYTVPSHRTLVGTVWATGWTFLGGLYPWYAKLVFGYQYLLISTSVISVALILMCPFIPESASWLVSAGRIEDAIDNLVKMARFNGKKDVSEAEFKTLLHAIDPTSNTELGSVSSAASEISTSSISSFWAETVALVTTPNLRRTTMLLFSSWFLICLCYHADTLGLGHMGLSIYPTYSMSAAFELPINIFTIFCLDSVGRRWPNVCFMATAGILAFTFAAVGDSGGEAVTMILAVFLIVSLAGSYNITYQLAAELFPTVVRGRGVLLSKVCGDMGNIIAALVAYLIEINKNALILLVGAFAFLAATLLFFIPETTHQPLPQTLEDGELFGKDQPLCYCPIFVDPDSSLKKRKDPTRASMSNVSYTSGRPANSVQPTSTPKTNPEFGHSKRKDRKNNTGPTNAIPVSGAIQVVQVVHDFGNNNEIATAPSGNIFSDVQDNNNNSQNDTNYNLAGPKELDSRLCIIQEPKRSLIPTISL
ncbi:solute carrier family 22 member 8-like [Varroa destructor]|uniref:Major facilitator superfamily (MFS) profile domain-containing protein n=1 Tax=Varroa destructor TaxID=109461 RepID=A0A7M7JJY5_VARDE|nr:solute carrier family 22 member 8-like [Varroa destructor]XP_022653340.1 solute carrier family 22 member 8-like [Varroa destructor]XP_022653341.1 solute carrier family 22 member 8-like [Varroa destructor]XP_022653342.1 solute carrier family 22 member 8-like [Varroa destructor]